MTIGAIAIILGIICFIAFWVSTILQGILIASCGLSDRELNKETLRLIPRYFLTAFIFWAGLVGYFYLVL